MRIIELHVVLNENGWLQLPPELLRALEITPGNMLSFYADKEGFRVKGTTKPPYFHASTEQPPSALQALVPETHTEPPAHTIFTAP